MTTHIIKYINLASHKIAREENMDDVISVDSFYNTQTACGMYVSQYWDEYTIHPVFSDCKPCIREFRRAFKEMAINRHDEND